MIPVTGGAGFIGSNFVLYWLAKLEEPVITLDKLTYAPNSPYAASKAASDHIFDALAGKLLPIYGIGDHFADTQSTEVTS